jgi:uroporphyrinogen decarboxylase
MQPRERFLETVLFGHPDRVPLTPGGPRESTLRAWHEQGLPEGAHYLDALADILGVHPEAFETIEGVPASFRMIPTFEEKVLEHRDGHYVVQDWMGAITEISDTYDYTYIRSAKDFVTRKWHRFPVQGREDWEKVSWRYDPGDPARIPADLAARSRELASAGKALAVSINGPFWQMREWVGMENLCLMMLDQADFVDEMAEFWRRFTLEVLEAALRQVHLDVVLISEDMAYKAHSMISPAMARRFLQPTYLSWHELLYAYDCPVLDMDSDGEVTELIPLWIESGINCCDPIEVAAGTDIVAFRRRFGRRMAYRGGIDKRAIAAGGRAMRDEVMRVVPPLLEEGGFIPSCDHGVPPDISWPSFIEYARLLAQLTGWL